MNRTIDHQGCQIAYDVSGSGQPVLLIQGVGIHGDGWLPQVAGLAEEYACISFDNRGMGRSQPVSAAPLTVEQMADDARAILDAEGRDSVHVVGHSLGGLIAVYLALSNPKRVRSLSLLCTFASGRAAAPLTLRMMWLGMRTRIGTRRMRRHGFLRLVMSPESLVGTNMDELADRLAPLFGHDLADQPAIVGKQLRAMRAADAGPQLGKLAGIPTLVVSAAYDPIAPPQTGRVLAGGIPGARYIEIPDASHGLPIQFPDRVNAMLLEHFKSADANRTG